MGTLRKRGDSWQAIADLGRHPVTGRRQLPSRSFKIRPGFKAEAAAKKWIRDTESRGIAEDNGTVADYLSKWLPGLQFEVRKNTWDWYDSTIRTHILPGIGMAKLRDLSPEILKAFYAKVPQLSVRRVHVVTRRFLGDAVRSELLIRNPASLVRKPKLELKNEPLWWSAMELGQWLETANRDRLRAAWRLLAMTGMRRGEALGLYWSDIDWNNSSITINRAFTVSGIGPPKTRSSYRTIDIDATTLAELRDHRKRQIEEQLEAEGFWHKSDLVFTDLMGSPLDPRNFTKKFRSLCHQAKVRRIRLHELRDTHGSLLIIDGEHPKVVQERLGHSDISITLGLYAHVMASMGKGAAQRAADILNFTPSPR